MRSNNRLTVIAIVAFALVAGSASAAPSQSTVATQVASTTPVSEITFIKSSDTSAIIRSRDKVLDKLKVGDHVGTAKALVKEISPGRLVLEETFTGKDGEPNRAVVVIKAGERGGTRYLQRADEPHFTGTRPVQVTPATPDVVKPSPKKPGPM